MVPTKRNPVTGLSSALSRELLLLLAAAAAAKSLQSRPTLCNPIDGSPPGSPVPGILQAKTLEWVTISFSNAWKWKVKVKSLSRVRLLATPRTAAHQAPPSMGFSRQEYWSGVLLPSPIQVWPKSNPLSNPLWLYSGSDRKIQGIKSDRQSAWRTIDGGLWHCTRGSDQDHPNKRNAKRQNGCQKRPYK